MAVADYTGGAVTIFYVDGENGNDANSDVQAQTFATAWKTLQHAFDRVASATGGTPGDGDEIRVAITSDDSTHYAIAAKNTITWSGKEVMFIGCNASGTVDGTRPTIYGTSLNGTTPMFEVSVATADHAHFVHFIFDANDVAQHTFEVTTANSHQMQFVDCQFKQATGNGVEFNGVANQWSFLSCQFDNNGAIGCNQDGIGNSMYYNCLFNDNVGDGCFNGTNVKMSNCVSYSNGGDGFGCSNAGALYVNCVSDANTSDGWAITGTTGQGMLVNCVATNNGAYGIVLASGGTTRLYNFHTYNNTSGAKSVGGTDELSIFEHYTSVVNPTWEDAANFDFTPNGDSLMVGGGIAMPLQYFGSSTTDAGIGMFRTSPYQIQHHLPTRH